MEGHGQGPYGSDNRTVVAAYGGFVALLKHMVSL